MINCTEKNMILWNRELQKLYRLKIAIPDFIVTVLKQYSLITYAVAPSIDLCSTLFSGLIKMKIKYKANETTCKLFKTFTVVNYSNLIVIKKRPEMKHL